MDYEKAHKEALVRAKEQMEACGDNEGRKMILYIFPELQESEDERIRSELVRFLRWVANGEAGSMPSAARCQNWLSWLEKQKKQKPVSIWNNTEETPAPANRDILCWYRKPDGKLNGEPYIVEFSSDEEVRRETEALTTISLAYWAELPQEEFDKTYWWKKQKPAEWSEKDEETRNWLCHFVENYGDSFYGHNKENVINWLKSLRPQSHWKPNEEQLHTLMYAIKFFKEHKKYRDETGGIKYLESLYDDLKKLI